jgi:hypothetical protein
VEVWLSLARSMALEAGNRGFNQILGIFEGWGTMWWDRIISTSAYTDDKLYPGSYLDMEDKFRDCFDAFLEFQDHFRRCQQLPGLVMHFTRCFIHLCLDKTYCKTFFFSNA